MSDLGSPDITNLILDEHAEFRGQFVALWDLRPGGEADSIAGAWQPLADLLEVHAERGRGDPVPGPAQTRR